MMLVIDSSFNERRCVVHTTEAMTPFNRESNVRVGLASDRDKLAAVLAVASEYGYGRSSGQLLSRIQGVRT